MVSCELEQANSDAPPGLGSWFGRCLARSVRCPAGGVRCLARGVEAAGKGWGAGPKYGGWCA